MEDEERKEEYNMFYIMTFGVVLGIAFAGNLFTMFIFYEILTLITLPLIIHPLTKEAKKAGNYYLYFSLSGSVLALIGLIIITITAGNSDFILGGILNSKLSYAYLISFLGFGVKAAIFPFSFWLPMASAAPTPTTALLHAVAVVKAGVFAIMRITYYNFNYTLLQNTWVQYVVMMLSAFTIIFGSTVALKEQHFKRRLAYSTISNLSYILLGVTLFSKSGLIAAILHFIFHSITKICLFFACGAIIKNSSAHYVFELNSLGKKMPLTFTFFTIASLSLTGIPLFAGFISKWYLINASITNGSVFAYIGSGSLILSALLTAIYTLSISLRGFLYPVNPKYEQIYQQAHEPNLIYLITIGVFALACVVFGIFSNSFIGMIENMFGGLL
jgi:multicomponent Na+:H+ antiporter subunit D